MTKKNKALLPTTSEPEDNSPADVAEGDPTLGINAEAATESTGETAVPVNETEVTAPDAAPKSTPKKISLPIHKDFEIPDATMNGVKQQAKTRIQKLQRGIKYTASQICGMPYWKMLPKVDKIIAGVCLSRLVADKQLPLMAAGTNSSNAKVYVLI